MRRKIASGAGSASRKPSTSLASPSSAVNRAGWFPDQTEDPARPHASEAQGGQPGDAAAHAPLTPIGGQVAGACRQGLLQLPRSADQHSRTRGHSVTKSSGRWRRTLCRRSEQGRYPMDWHEEAPADDWLPQPHILHPWPNRRFAVRHPRWEPYAGKLHVRICAGGCSAMSIPTATTRQAPRGAVKLAQICVKLVCARVFAHPRGKYLLLRLQ